MTYNQIISLLKLEGVGSKQKVLQMLENANDTELKELRDSIDLKLELETEKHRIITNKVQN